MSKYAVGDKLKCIKTEFEGFTLGKIYTISVVINSATYGGKYSIMDDKEK